MPAKIADILETVTCTRCGGCGKFSYNQIHGDRCYGCGGSGRKLTKRGVAAKAYHRSLLEVPSSQVMVGDRVFVDAGGIGRGGWATVTEVGPDLSGDRVNIRTEICALGNFPDTPVVVGGLDAEVRSAIAQSVAAFQAGLTKAGTPRKVRVAA